MAESTRREFLKQAAVAAGAVGLTACTSGGRPGPSPSERALATDTQWPIKRVVYLMLENRSFDHLFGRFLGVNGVTTGVRDGHEVPMIDAPQWLPGDLPHTYKAAIESINDGKMDRFVQNDVGSYYAYSQMRPEYMPNYWRWAENYVLCDNFFASALGPSHANHLYMIAGQSGGTFDLPIGWGTAVINGQKVTSWGCDAKPGTYALVKDDQGKIHRHSTCFEFPTVGDQLTEKGIDWAYYSAMPGRGGYYWNAYNAIGHIYHTDQWDLHIRNVERLLPDLASDTLPTVTWITPRFQLSDHPPFSSCYSQDWVTMIVNRLMRSPMWPNTVIFITWDEWGGFYDHVRPPVLDPIGLGFRVPMLVISPYAKKGYVDRAQGEFSTPLRFIADNWGLPYLTERIRRTHNFSHVFDFRAPPRPPDPAPRIANCVGEGPWHFYRDLAEWPKKLWHVEGWWTRV